ncbi:MAG: hypothetical protein J5I47_09755 [Vicingus serpentipes]|nr:hypothetical protein [Vicingus serpentipes]
MLTLLLFSCTAELEEKIAQLEKEKLEANSNLEGKEELIVDFINSMNEIEANLSSIKEKENVVTTRFDEGNVEMDDNMKDQIINDINLINDLLQDNKNKMAALNKKLKSSNVKIAQLEKMIEGLAKRIQEKDAEIASLQNQLAAANQQLKVLFEEYNNRLEELGDKEDKLNTAFYCYGSSKELIENGIITKQGGFIGIGKTEKLSADFNKEYFTQVDISTVTEIPLMSEKVKVVTNHPTSSYKIEGGEKEAKKLVILKSEDFWGASKYLVVVVG